MSYVIFHCYFISLPTQYFPSFYILPFWDCIKVLNMILISTSLTSHDVEYLCHMFREHLKVAYELENSVIKHLLSLVLIFSMFPYIDLSIF